MATITTHRMPIEKWLGYDSYAGKKQCYLANNTLPQYNDLKQSLGIPLTELIFQYGLPDIVPTHQMEKISEELQLEGTKGSLWASPSEQLQQKLNLKMPTVRRGEQVLCFTSVQKIGEEIERGIEDKYKKDYENKIKEIYSLIESEFQDKVDKVRDKIKRDMLELYTIRLRDIFFKLCDEFKESITDREKVLVAEAERNKIEAVNVVRKSMEEELNNSIKLLKDNYKIRLNFVAKLNSNQIRENYIQKINLYNNKWTELVAKAEESEKIKQAAIVQNLQRLFSINLVDVILKERNECYLMMENTALFFIDKMNLMQDQIQKLYDSLKDAENQLKLNNIEMSSWQCLLTDLVEEFQKFVNYVLKAVPGDAEYVLSLEKLLERRKQTFMERLKAAGKIIEEIHPLPSGEKIAEKEGIESDSVNEVIQSIMEYILYRGDVEISGKRSHEGVQELTEPQIMDLPIEPERSASVSPSVSMIFTVESVLTPTLSPVPSTLSSLSTDKSYLSYLIRPDVDVEDEYAFVDEMNLYGGEMDDEFDEIFSKDELLEDIIWGDRWILSEWESEDDYYPNRIEEFEDELFEELISSELPVIITDMVDIDKTSFMSFESVTTIVLPSSSDIISSISSDIEKCEDGTVKKTKSMVELEAEKYARRAMGLTFVGTEVPPSAVDKGTFVQGRILSILDIMRGHPKLHNFLVEP